MNLCEEMFFSGLPLEQMSYSLCTPSALCCVVCMLLWQDDDKKFNWNRSMVPYGAYLYCLAHGLRPGEWSSITCNDRCSDSCVDDDPHVCLLNNKPASGSSSKNVGRLLLLVGLSDVVHDEQSMLVWLTDAIGLWDTWVIFASWHSSLLLQRWCFFSGLILGCIFRGYLFGGRLGALLSDFIIWMLTWLVVQDLRGFEFLPQQTLYQQTILKKWCVGQVC